jgi:hypothetical protein
VIKPPATKSGCSVDTYIIHPDGHHYAHDGDFLCADCWGSADEARSPPGR